MQANLKGLSFADVRRQETIRYLDNMACIAETGRERRIEEMTEELQLRREAQARASS